LNNNLIQYNGAMPVILNVLRAQIFRNKKV